MGVVRLRGPISSRGSLRLNWTSRTWMVRGPIGFRQDDLVEDPAVALVYIDPPESPPIITS